MYERYLRSPRWRRVRHAVFKDSGGKCARCGKRASQVHHLTYERVGRERPSDTQALCAPCHMTVHGRKWPVVISERTEVRDGREFTVKVLKPYLRRK